MLKKLQLNIYLSWKPVVFLCAIMFIFQSSFGQQNIEIKAVLNNSKNEIYVQQQLKYTNNTNEIINFIAFNDWNHAFSDKNTPLAKRFSDEFSISFHLAKEKDRGFTRNIRILDEKKQELAISRPENAPDILKVFLNKPLMPGQEIVLEMLYEIKLPNARFTGYGFYENGNYVLKDIWLLPARIEHNQFLMYHQLNLDDAVLEISNFDVTLQFPSNLNIHSDLTEIKRSHLDKFENIHFKGTERVNFTIVLEKERSFLYFKNQQIEVASNLKNQGVDDLSKTMLMNKIIQYVQSKLGNSKSQKLMVTQTNYDRNPVYGINQLPSFLAPFSDDFIYEIQFLKTYLDAYLTANLSLNLRKESWILDGIQIFMMIQYMEEKYPNAKMMGNISKIKLLKSYHLMNLDFNEQYSYFYMLMARKNLDQPIHLPKDELIKFNEQIANKYKSGLNFNYLDNYLGKNIVMNSIRDFLQQNTKKDAASLEVILSKNANQNIEWFFEDFMLSRKLVDFTLHIEEKKQDSVTLKLQNKSGLNVPIPVFGIKNKEIVWKKWFENVEKDTLFKVSVNDFDRMVVNYEQKVPEYNLRNNWQKTKPNLLFNRRFKFNLVRDLEDPNFNQIMANPVLIYSLYDGLSPGMRFHNKAILDKPFTFDVVPIYASLTQSLIGNFNFTINDFRRESRLFHIRYMLPGSYFHYAPDASYFRLTPLVQMRVREKDFRDNRKQMWMIRNVNVFRETSEFTVRETENYSVFNLKYVDTYTEMTKHFSYNVDVQAANLFGKIFAEVEFRHLNQNNRQFNLRVFAGSFLYRNTKNDFFSFHLDRPTDYMFDFPLYGRSESKGLFSQQFIMTEGGFKSRMENPFANHWMTTINGSASLWKWIEIYGDLGLLKNQKQNTNFYYDSGIRLNLVTDYFEVYFPVYSSIGWEVSQNNYGERIRFMLTLNPKILTTLFTRSWF